MTRSWWRRGRPCGAAPSAVRSLAWQEASYCVIDVETTGLNLARDCIISYGAVMIDHARINPSASRYSLVKNDCQLSPAAVGVHTLREVDLRDAPTQEQAARNLAQLLDTRVLVAHAAWVEKAFLGRLLHQIGRRPGGVILDTAALGRAAGHYSLRTGSEPSLESLALALGTPVHPSSRAEGRHGNRDCLSRASLTAIGERRDSRGSAAVLPRPPAGPTTPTTPARICMPAGCAAGAG